MNRRLLALVFPLAIVALTLGGDRFDVGGGTARAGSPPVVIVGPGGASSAGQLVSLSAQCGTAVPATPPWLLIALAGGLFAVSLLARRRKRLLGMGIIVVSALALPTTEVSAQSNACSGVAWTASLGAQQFTGSGATFSFTPTTQATYHVTATLGGFTAATDVAVGAGCADPPLTGGVQECGSTSEGNVGADTWILRQTGSGGCMTPFGVGAAYGATWSNSGDFMAREGVVWNETQTYSQMGTIAADFAETRSGSTGGFSYIGAYGWSVNPLHEYYIVEDWAGGAPPTNGGTLEGSYVLDSATYRVYAVSRVNQPVITGGNGTYVQYMSVRQTVRSCGHVSITDHFNQWAALGLTLGNMEEATLLVETGGGTGTLSYSYANVTVY